MKVVCQRCKNQILDRLKARCPRCVNQLIREQISSQAAPAEEADRDDTVVARVLMRLSRYNASDAYYPQTLSILRLDRPAVLDATDGVQVLRSMLPRGQATASPQDVVGQLATLTARITQAAAIGDMATVDELRARLGAVALGTAAATSTERDSGTLPALPEDMQQAVSESLAFRQTVRWRPAARVAQTGGGASALMLKGAAQRQAQLRLNDVLYIKTSVIAAAFGFTRRHFEPVYKEQGADKLPTQIRAFPVCGQAAAQAAGNPGLLGMFPILARRRRTRGALRIVEPRSCSAVAGGERSFGSRWPHAGDCSTNAAS